MMFYLRNPYFKRGNDILLLRLIQKNILALLSEPWTGFPHGSFFGEDESGYMPFTSSAMNNPEGQGDEPILPLWQIMK